MGFVPKKKEREGEKTDCVPKVDVKSLSFVAMETVQSRNVYIEIY